MEVRITADAITVRPLSDADLADARLVHRRAFARFLGMEPDDFRPGADCIGPRWRLWRDGGVAAIDGDRLVGTGLLIHWGSACILGPLTVDPDVWGRGVARALMGALIDRIDEESFTWTGLFTHPQSAKHIRLYETFGFAMRRITAVMSKPIDRTETPARPTFFAGLSADRRADAMDDIRHLGERIFPGLDWRGEVRSIHDKGLGETLLMFEGDRVSGVACIHYGAGSEATDGDYYVKLAAVLPGDGADDRFARLVAAIDAAAAQTDARRIVAGTNTGRTAAYRMMQEAGYRTDMNGIAMFRPAADGYNTDSAFVIDDWR